MNNKFSISKKIPFKLLGLFAIVFFVSCEFELPEAGSLPDNILPEANYSYVRSGNTLADFKFVSFTNASSEATKYEWDFGVGVVCDTATVDGILTIICSTETTSAEKDVPLVKFEDGEGTYPVTLTASDANGSSSDLTLDVEVIDQFVAINPTVQNGDFSITPFTTEDWKVNAFTDGTTTAPNTTSDGNSINYDGSDNGSKTPGMKFASGTSNPANPGGRRYAYQTLTVSPTTTDRTVKYILEYDYAITAGAGTITFEVLDGHFEDDGADALASSTGPGPLGQSVATETLGKGNFTTEKMEFTSNGSGLISIWIYAELTADGWIDNVKLYPKP
ncbi:PKD domain-containing protein [Ekhidna sp.]